MIKIVSGDILKVTSGVIVQQVNCKGAMGAGLAKQIRSKYPGIYNEYLSFIKRETDENVGSKSLLGKVQYYFPPYLTYGYDVSIANCFGQDGYGGGQQTVNTALRTALEQVRDDAEISGNDIAIPWGLGCGLAGGDWDRVIRIILSIFKNSSADATIYVL
ncbi:MAG: Appr-1-p processing protein [Clostridiales bacterium]|nr:Appr-1-p processing protein [Clostridiales bacterium]